MATEVPGELPRDVRAFIVLAALLLYLADVAQRGHGWWLAGRSPQVYWYTLVVAVPTLMTLAVQRLGDGRFWYQALGVAVIYALLAGWAAWSVTGAPGIDPSAVLMPFGITAGGALFVALPFLQCRQAHGAWRAPYPELFDRAWQNGLILIVAGLLTAACWLALLLWAQLFLLVRVRVFDDLFFHDRSFGYLATGLFAGLGILIGRTQEQPVRAARGILFALCRGLLPLVALIALLFLASLPFTGLAPLWSTRSAAGLLLGLLLLLTILVNAVWQDGLHVRAYPAWLRVVVDAALVLSPVFAGLALVALGLRIGQHGWTGPRVWAILIAAVLTGHALGLAWAALDRRGAWLRRLPRGNVALACGVLVLAACANSPLLDPYRITVRSQVARLDAGRIAPAMLDLRQLRIRSGRRGYEAAVALQRDPAMAGDPAALAFLRRSIAHPRVLHPWGGVAGVPEQAVATVAALRTRVRLAPGVRAPDAAWYTALLARRIGSAACLRQDADCVLLTPDLRGDGQHQNVLCNLGNAWLDCDVSLEGAEGWHRVAGFKAYVGGQQQVEAVQRALLAGRIRAEWPCWPAVAIAGVTIRVDGDTDCGRRGPPRPPGG